MLAKHEDNFQDKQLKFISILYILIPVFLISGPFLSDLSLVLIDIFFLSFVIIKRKFNFFDNFFFKFFLLFYFFLLLSAIFSNNLELSLIKTIPYIRFGIFFLAISILLKKSIKEKIYLNKVYKILMLIFIILLIDSIFQFIFHKNIIGIQIDDTKRVSSFFGEELIMGSFVLRFSMILMGLLFFLEKKKKYFFCVTIISFILIILSSERTAFFLFIMFNLILFFKFKLFKNKNNLLILLFGFLVLLPFGQNKYSYDRLFKMTIEQFVDEKNNLIFFTPSHNALYKTSINIYKDHPIFGSGLKTFRSECKKDKYKSSELGCSTHPHNIYLNILSETGIIVFLFFLIFYAYVCTHLIKLFFTKLDINYKKFEFVLYLSLFINFFPLAPSGNFFNNWLSIIFYYNIAIITWLNSKKYEKNNN
jgi:O-antigen ligase